MTLEPTDEQLREIVALVPPDYLGLSRNKASKLFAYVRDIVLEEAEKACEGAMGEAQRAEAFLATGAAHDLEQLEYARRKGAEKCLVRIRAMKGRGDSDPGKG